LLAGSLVKMSGGVVKVKERVDNVSRKHRS